MNVSLDLAFRGIKSAMDQQATIAKNITQMQSSLRSGDIIDNSTQQLQNKHAVAANASVAKSVDTMLGNLIDVVA